MGVTKRRLNVDVAGKIVELQAVLKDFKLKQDIYRIIFRGKGLEFDGYRDFTPDDNAEDIDWKTSARTQKLIVKKYKEERDLKIMFLIDVGTNMVFGSTEKIKCEYVTELVAAFSNIMFNSNDKIGFLFFSNEIKQFSDFRSGFKHFSLFVDLMSDAENYGGKTDLNKALDFAMDYLDDSVMSVIIVSDFLGVNKGTEKKLNLLSHRFETIALRVRDPLDLALPNIEGEIVLEDSESHEQVVVNPMIARVSYQQYAFEQGRHVEEMFKRTEVDFLDLITNKSFTIPLASFLKKRLLIR